MPTAPQGESAMCALGAMAGKYRNKPNVERWFVWQELIAGSIALMGKLVALVLAIVLGVIAVKHAPHASEWRVTAGSGGASFVLVRIASLIGKVND